jgi:predicted secreted protein
MTPITAIALYFVLWWLCLFITLPWGNRSQAEHGERHQGTDPGAPVVARLRLKLVATTLIAGVLLGLLSLALSSEALQTYWG